MLLQFKSLKIAASIWLPWDRWISDHLGRLWIESRCSGLCSIIWTTDLVNFLEDSPIKCLLNTKLHVEISTLQIFS